MKILFLSCDKLDGFVVDDNLLVKKLTSDGHTVTTLSWSSEHDWSQFDCAIIRTTWDYMERPDEFIAKLSEISSQTKLYNDLATVKWNIHKGYLKELEEKGACIVPTVFFTHTEDLKIPSTWAHSKVVIKPAISAGSFKTIVIEKSEIGSGKYKSELFPGDWMCQPFLPQITEGEISLIYFNKIFSHTLLKVPMAGEFRVQEEFGGAIVPLKASAELLSIGDKIISFVADELLYARVDLVPFENTFALMELELIEPALYFRTDEKAVDNFSKALSHVEKR